VRLGGSPISAAGLPHGSRVPPLAVDIETGSVDERWSAGNGYVRLCGYLASDGATRITPNADALVELLHWDDRRIVTHNGMGFDLVVLAHRHGLDLQAILPRVVDTVILARLADPPAARVTDVNGRRRYDLDSVGQRLVGAGKGGDLKAMAKKHGGFDQIPLDDSEYRTYLEQDVRLTADISTKLPMTRYAIREHKVAAIAAQIMLSGFAVDVPTLEARITHAQTKRALMLQRLYDAGLPEAGKAPHRSKVGLEAIGKAFEALGVQLPKTKNGSPSLGKEVMAAHADGPAGELAQTISSLQGIRSTDEDIAAWMVDGRVHAEIDMRQASGRWSTTKPALSTLGKRGGKVDQRSPLVADEGCVLISADLSGIDARAVAVHAQDPEYLKLFEPGVDIHIAMCDLMRWGPERRTQAKVLSHGINYGMQAHKLAKSADISLWEAQRFLHMMEDRFPQLEAWKTTVRRQASEGVLLDNGFGRLLRPDIERAFTTAPALVGQGCARDLFMKGLLRMPFEMVRMVRAVVHDEVVLSVPVGIVDDVEHELIRALQFSWAPKGAKHEVKVIAELVGSGRSWADVYA
jgi:DNA polymerase-1